MASGMYVMGIQELLKGNVDLINDSISALLVSSSYSPDLTADHYQSDIPEAAYLSEITIDGKSITGTAFLADPVTFTDVEDGETGGGVVVLKNTGNAGSSVLLAFFDITPFTTDGSNVILTWDTDGVFEL